jgi:hypothetical protein
VLGVNIWIVISDHTEGFTEEENIKRGVHQAKQKGGRELFYFNNRM